MGILLLKNKAFCCVFVFVYVFVLVYVFVFVYVFVLVYVFVVFDWGIGVYINRETIDAVFDTIDIVEVISEYVPLKKKGANYMGLCPFHDEKTPSFVVNAQKGIYKCFGCGQAGSVVHFLQEYDKISFPEAIIELAKKYNIDIKTTSKEGKDAYTKHQQEFEATQIVFKKFIDYFANKLHQHDGAMNYLLQERQLNEKSVDEFQLGFIPSKIDDFIDEIKQTGHNIEYLLKQGIINARFSNRNFGSFYDEGLFSSRYQGILIPVKDHLGRVVGFASRYLNDAGSDPFKKEKRPRRSDDSFIIKFTNSPADVQYMSTSGRIKKSKTLYNKRKLLYGLYETKQLIRELKNKHEAVPELSLVEGYFDLILLHQNELPAVASTGTSFTIEQARQLKRLGIDSINVLKDGDFAGLTSAQKDIFILSKEGIEPKPIILPEGQDPDDFLRSKTNPLEAYAQLKKEDLGFFLAKVELENYKKELEKTSGLLFQEEFSKYSTKIRIAKRIFGRDEFKEQGINESILLPYLDSIAKVLDFKGKERKIMINSFIDELTKNSQVRYKLRRNEQDLPKEYSYQLGNAFLAQLFLQHPNYLRSYFKEIPIKNTLFSPEQQEIYKLIQEELKLPKEQRELDLPFDTFKEQRSLTMTLFGEQETKQPKDFIKSVSNFLTHAKKEKRISSIPPQFFYALQTFTNVVLEEKNDWLKNPIGHLIEKNISIKEDLQYHNLKEKKFSALASIIKTELAVEEMKQIRKELLEKLSERNQQVELSVENNENKTLSEEIETLEERLLDLRMRT